jgi:uncharacterized protein YbjT (DUF2867 family)
MARLFIGGATGLVGSLALSLALADARVSQVVAPTRRPVPGHPRLLNPSLDGMFEEDRPDAWRADGAICAIGTTRAKAGSAAAFRAVDHDLVIAMARRLRAGNVQRFALTSALGADARSWFLYPRTKGEVEEAIMALGFPSLTILRPGFLDGDRQEDRPVERAFGRVLRVLAPVLPPSARVSPAGTVAKLLVEAAIQGPAGTQVIDSARIARG